MSNWFYYDNDRQKRGPFTGKQIKELAEKGKITPDTILENETGKSTPAKNTKGLTFPEKQASEVPTQPVKKHPNPLAAPNSMAGIWPTLATKEEYENYRKSILTPLATPLPIVEKSNGYTFGLMLLAFFLILLPLVYFSAIIGLCVVEYHYCTVVLPMAMEHENAKVLIYYFIPPTAILALILILLKPLFFGWGRKPTEFEISREREPLLFELVDHVCDFVGAPVPNKIVVDCRVNAAAGLSRGFWGALFGGNDSDLYIGLPLVAGMTTSEFAGVLAHEFGHFTQSGSRRMTYIVHTLLNWFAHIYYYRDWMDNWLIAGSKTGLPINIAFCYAVRGVIRIGRGIIWCLMMLGNLAAGYMSRQMEFDADEFQAQLCGSECLAVSSLKGIMLGFADQKTINDLNYMLTEERLADNYPLLITVNARIHSVELQRSASKVIQEEKAGLFSTHPCTRERIKAAQDMNVPGVLHVNLPASLLFRNFIGLCREVSLHFYRDVVGINVESHMLRNSGDVTKQFQREDMSMKAITNFFQRTVQNGLLLPSVRVDEQQNFQEAVRLLQKVRDQQANCAADAYDAIKAYDKVYTQWAQAEFFRALVRIDVKPNFSGLDFRFRTRDEANRTVDKFATNRAALESRLDYRRKVAAERLTLALRLLKFSEIQNRIEDGPELLHRIETLMPILTACGSMQRELDEVSDRLNFASFGLGMLPTMKPEKAQLLWENILSDNDLYRRVLLQFRKMFESVPYPFDHGKKVMLGEFLMPTFNEVALEPLEYFYGSVYSCLVF